MDFGISLTNEQKIAILTQRISQFSAEGYQHQINKQIAQELNDAEALQVATDALALLETIVTAHQTELNTIISE